MDLLDPLVPQDSEASWVCPAAEERGACWACRVLPYVFSWMAS